MARNLSTAASRRRKDGEEMTDKEVVAFVGRKTLDALNGTDGDISEQRKTLLERYRGEPYGDERKGYSQFTTREVLETVEWVLPAVLKVFLSGDDVVEFEAQGEEDEDQARLETAAVNRTIIKANNGYGFYALYCWFKDALMYPNAYLKAHIEEKIKTSIENYTDVNEFGLAELSSDEELTIIEQDSKLVDEPVLDPVSGQPAIDPATGQPAMRQAEYFDLKVRRRAVSKEFRLDPVPGEEALVDNALYKLDIDAADFSGHRLQLDYTTLVNMGVDQDILDSVGEADNYDWGDEKISRLFYDDETPETEDEDDPSMKMFWVHDVHALFDYDGDGLAEFRHVMVIGDQVALNEEVSYQPLVALSSIIMPHKHTGMSVAEIVQDLQKLKTALTRQMLDNVYSQNLRRKFVNVRSMTDDGSTMEALLNRQAEIVPVMGSPMEASAPDMVQSIIGEILPVIQHVDDRQANRTGITPNLSLDPSVLQQSTMGAFMGALEQASQRVEMLVRIFAETGMRPLMAKTRQLLKMHPKPFKMKFGKKWTNVNPSDWGPRSDIAVNVGLGFNNPQQMVGMLMQLLQIQKEAAMAGLSQPAHLFNTMQKLTRAANLGEADQYFSDPGPAQPYQPPEPPQPDPLMVAQAQALESEAGRKNQETQMNGQIATAKHAATLKMDAHKQQAENRKIDLQERAQLLKELEFRERNKLDTDETLARIALIGAQEDKTRVDMFAVAAEFSTTIKQAKEALAQTDPQLLE